MEKIEKNIEIKEIKQRTPIDWENIASYIFYGLVFLLPIFILPFTVNSLVLSKAILAYLAIGLTFIFWLLARLQKGNLIVPKSALLLSLAGIIVVWLLASVFSGNFKLSLLGAGYEVGTFAFFLFLGLLAFLISVLFQSEKKAVALYLLLFISAFIAFVFQFAHIVFGPSFISSNFFPFKTSNLIGSWNDFFIFFGFVALAGMAFFELFDFSRAIKGFLLALIAFSLLSMAAVNFGIGWNIFGFFVIVFLVYFFSRQFSENNFYSDKAQFYSPRRLLSVSFAVLLLVFFFILARGLLADFNSFLGTNTLDVRPSWSATYEVAEKTLKERPVLGSGPNTFLYDWLRFKPEAINSTIFWDTRFQSGVGTLPSMVATTGALGGLAILAFLACLVYCGLKVISLTKNGLRRALAVASFLGSLYLWTFTIFYSPGFLIFALAFISTGILVGLLVQAEKIKTIDISFSKNPKIGFISVLAIVLLVLTSVFVIYLFAQKYWAAYSYTDAITVLNSEGDLNKAEEGIAKSSRLDQQDLYFRALSDIGIFRIQEILSQTGVSPDILRNQFQIALGVAITNAQTAVNLNSSDPLNWMQLGKIYESVAPLKIEGARELAIDTYKKALDKSPMDPSPYLAIARMEASLGDADSARKFIDSALAIKSDFTSALLFLAQMEASEGNLDEAIARTEQTVAIAPNDTGALFQLGMLYYQDKNYENARFAFERVVEINPEYSNARYFLGLIYDRQNLTGKAIEQFVGIEELNPDNQEVKRILSNLRQGRGALENISPPAEPPEEREEPPVEE